MAQQPDRKCNDSTHTARTKIITVAFLETYSVHHYLSNHQRTHWGKLVLSLALLLIILIIFNNLGQFPLPQTQPVIWSRRLDLLERNPSTLQTIQPSEPKWLALRHNIVLELFKYDTEAPWWTRGAQLPAPAEQVLRERDHEGISWWVVRISRHDRLKLFHFTILIKSSYAIIHVLEGILCLYESGNAETSNPFIDDVHHTAKPILIRLRNAKSAWW